MTAPATPGNAGAPGAPAPQRPAPAPQPPQEIRMKKGDILFREGENAGAMYLIRKGILRIYKKKGESDIELDTLRAGQIVGEMAFLDGNPRSASAEALTETDLVEISGPAFKQVLDRIPEWLKVLIKALVTRLRSASTKIRQLETASQEYYFNDKDGRRVAMPIYLSEIDVMKIATGMLFVATRWGQPLQIAGRSTTEVKMSVVERFVNQIMGIPASKITSVADAFGVAGILKADDTSGSVGVIDMEFLEKFIFYMNEENLKDHTKRHDITNRGFLIMSLMAKHIHNYPEDDKGVATINVAEVMKLETPKDGKAPFRMDDFAELVRLGYASNVSASSAEIVTTQIHVESFLQATRMQRALKSIEAVNDQKARFAAQKK